MAQKKEHAKKVTELLFKQLKNSRLEQILSFWTVWIFKNISNFDNLNWEIGRLSSNFYLLIKIWACYWGKIKMVDDDRHRRFLKTKGGWVLDTTPIKDCRGQNYCL